MITTTTFVIGLLPESFIWPAIVTVARGLSVLSILCNAGSGVGVVTVGFSGGGAAAGVGVGVASDEAVAEAGGDSATPVTGTDVGVDELPSDEPAGTAGESLFTSLRIGDWALAAVVSAGSICSSSPASEPWIFR